MLAAQVYMRATRTLVPFSGVPLRGQIEEKFATLGHLPTAKAVPPSSPVRASQKIAGGIRSVEEAQALLDHANVFVALPNSIDASNTDAIAYLTRRCSDLFIDEVHHAVAATWNAVRERFADKRILQFTATPFRRDGNRVDGRIIFNYKLGDAQAAWRRLPLSTAKNRSPSPVGILSGGNQQKVVKGISFWRVRTTKIGASGCAVLRLRHEHRAARGAGGKAAVGCLY
jgi:Type III restriction enzyme, res subunit